jgi:uncharacterized protein
VNYSEGRTGRVIIARFDDGEDFVSGMKKLVQKAKLTSGLIFFLGALRSGEIVVGPVEDAIPPEPGWVSLEGVWEVVGIGTLFQTDGKPSLHLHGSYGRKRQSLTGCLRKIAEVFLVVEVIILELVGTDAQRVYDPLSGLFLLHPSPEK